MLHNINLFIRSLVFACVSITTIVMASTLCLLMLPFSLSARHAMVRQFLKFYMFLLKVICNIKYEVEGLENIPSNHFAIILSKHSSAWETFFLPILFHEPAVIAKRELIWVPFFGWALAAADPIFINRSDKVSAMQQIITKGKKCLDAGRWILVFPEGTRVPVGHVGKYHLGGARLAAATEAPVIPVAHNAGYFWPRRGFIKRPGTIKVVIGPVIETKGRTPDVIMALTKDWIESTVARIGGLVNKATG